jgi:hypothetical protein
MRSLARFPSSRVAHSAGRGGVTRLLYGRDRLWIMFPLLLAAFCLGACSSGSEPDEGNRVDIPANTMQYVVFAWNDLGMHCLNPTYDEAVILPPYNTVWAQVITRPRSSPRISL